MSLLKFNRNRFPWANDRFSSWLDTNNFFSDDFFVKDRNLPAMNVKENKDNFEIELAVPGFSKKDIEVSIENDMLHIYAEKSNKEIEEEENYTRKEFSYNTLDRRLQLPSSIGIDAKVNAAYKDGILTLHLTKKEDAKKLSKKIIDIA